MTEKSYLITSVRIKEKYVSLEVLEADGGVTKMRMTEKVWNGFGLAEKDEVGKEVFGKLKEASDICEAVTVTLRILSDTSCSEFSLRQKLRKKGVGEKASKYALEFAKKKGYLDEKTQAEWLALKDAENCFRGRSRIVKDLISKGYPADIAKRAADSVPEEVYATALEKAAAKKCRGTDLTERKEKEKVISSLMRAGFSYGEIAEEINRIIKRKKEEK